MIRLNQTDAGQNFAVTLNEAKTLLNPFYLFVFKNDMTKEEKPIVLISTTKGQYNIFQIDGSFFPGVGWYSFTVYEQDTFNNTLIEDTNGVVQTGLAFIASNSQDTFIQNDPGATEFKQYN